MKQAKQRYLTDIEYFDIVFQFILLMDTTIALNDFDFYLYGMQRLSKAMETTDLCFIVG